MLVDCVALLHASQKIFEKVVRHDASYAIGITMMSITREEGFAREVTEQLFAQKIY